MIDINYKEKILTADINMSMQDIYKAEGALRMQQEDHRKYLKVISAEGISLTSEIAMQKFILSDGWVIIYKDCKGTNND